MIEVRHHEERVEAPQHGGERLVGAGGAVVGLGRVQARGEVGGGVDAEERLPLPHPLAFPEENRHDPPVHLGPEVDLLHGLDLAGGGVDDADVEVLDEQ